MLARVGESGHEHIVDWNVNWHKSAEGSGQNLSKLKSTLPFTHQFHCLEFILQIKKKKNTQLALSIHGELVLGPPSNTKIHDV